MEVMFLDAPYAGKVELLGSTLKYLKEKKYTRVALYASVQFVNQLDAVKQALRENQIQVITSQADRTNVHGQLLGCDNYHNSLNLQEEADCFLYVGDGRFHPLALVFAQKGISAKEVIVNDPMQKKMVLLGKEDVKGILGKYKGSLVKFLSSSTIGVLVTIKPGQEQFKQGLKLEEKFPQKQFYYFIDNVVSFDQLENFPFIDVWVNTTCPRVGLDDQEKFVKGVINVNDALEVEKVLAGF